MATITGTTGHDSLVGTAGNDTIDGFAGDDVIDGAGGNDVLSGGDGRDSLLGGDGNDQLSGNAGFDTLDGGPGNDTLTAGVGGILIGGAGADVLFGAPSIIDTASWAGSTAAVVVNLAAGTALSSEGNDTLVSVEHVIGSAFGDTIIGSSAENTLDGAGGNDSIDGGIDDDTIIGGLGDDTLAGGDGIDQARYEGAGGAVFANLSAGTASGAHGNDLLSGFEELSGGNGNDSLTGSNVFNRLFGRDGNDTLVGLGAGDRLEGNAGHDSLDGGDGNDDLFGADGNDTLVGGPGNDDLYGEAGNDRLDGGPGADNIYLYDDPDHGAVVAMPASNEAPGTITYGNGEVDLLVAGSADTVNGSGFADSITGSPVFTAPWGEELGNDEIYASNGNDTVRGLGGNDFIDGGPGQDSLAGGEGNDTLQGGDGNDTLDGSGGRAEVGYFGANSGIVVDLAAGTAIDGRDGTDTLIHIAGVRGGNFGDALSGSSGDDYFIWSSGNDIIDGRAGIDSYRYDDDSSAGVVNLQTGVATFGSKTDALSGIEVVIAGSGADSITGSATADTLSGGDGNDTLAGGGGVDNLEGGAGNDRLILQRGSVDGGAGDDLLLLAGVIAGYRITAPSAGVLRLTNSTTLEDVRLAAVETVQFSDGSRSFAQLAAAAGPAQPTPFDDTLDGGSGNDSIDALAGDDLVDGGAGDDSLSGGPGADTLIGGAGNDTLDGGEVTDPLGSDANRASWAGAASGVVVNLAQGSAEGGGEFDELRHINQVIGSAFADTLIGAGPGDSMLFGLWTFFAGGGGNDSIVGAGPRDGLRYDWLPVTSGVVVDLAAGTAADGNGGTDHVSGIDGVWGTDFADRLQGSDDEGVTETFTGGAGNDTIAGRGGRDVASWRDVPAGVVVDLAAGTASDGEGGSDSLSGIEGVIGSAYDDTLRGSTSTALEVFSPGPGDDEVAGGGGPDQVDYSDADGSVSVDLVHGRADDDGFGGRDRLAGIEQVIGSAFDDEVYGDAEPNLLMGGAGEDYLSGEDDDDTLLGGAEDDTLIGGRGNDSLDGGLGDDYADGSFGSDTLHGNADDRLRGGPGDDHFVLAGGTVDYRNDPAAVEVDLGGAPGSLAALDGYEDEDEFEVLAPFSIIGSMFDDRMSGPTPGATFDGGWVAVNFFGADGDDALTGSDGNDLLAGDDGGDTLTGGAGDDTLRPGAGNDQVHGGAGRDWLSYEDAALGAEVSLGDGVAAEGGATVDQFDGIEGVIGSGAADLFQGSSSSQLESYEGLDGNDRIDGGGGPDEVSYRHSPASADIDLAAGQARDGWGSLDELLSIEHIIGTAFADTILGAGDANRLEALGGDDWVAGHDGDDTLIGGDGDDTLRGENGNDSIVPGAGADRLEGGPGNDTLGGGDGDDGSGDTLIGGAGNDVFDAGLFSTVSYLLSPAAVQVTLASSAIGIGHAADGLGGSDSFAHPGLAIEGSPFGDSIAGNDDGGSGMAAVWTWDTLGGGAGNDSIDGRAGYDLIAGNEGNDLIDGGAGTDFIFGDEGDDTLRGGAGDDTLLPGPGADSVAGGDGVDTLDFTLEAFTEAAGLIVDLVAGTASRHGGGGGDLISGIEIVRSGSGQDSISGDAIANLLDGGAGNDTLSGGAGDDTLYGGEGDDSLSAGSGIDSVDGGAGTDIVSLDLARAAYAVLRSGEQIQLMRGADRLTLNGVEFVAFSDGQVSAALLHSSGVTLTGTAGSDTLDGTALPDSISGLAGNDSLDGGEGDDTLDGGPGRDTLQGRGGNDHIVADVDDIVVGGPGDDTLDGGDFTVLSYADGGSTPIQVTLGSTLSERGVVLDGFGGTDSLSPHRWEIHGSSFGDLMTGRDDSSGTAWANDFFYGEGGNDTLIGRGSVDYLDGGAGDDSIDGGAHSDWLRGGSGQDTLIGDGGNDTLEGGGGDDLLVPGAHNATIDGGAGIDRLQLPLPRAGYQLADEGGALVLTQGGERIAFSGGETVQFADMLVGVQVLLDSLGLVLTGTAGNDSLSGGAGANSIAGLAGDDSLDGGDGDDTIDGGDGNDTVLGGVGNDRLSGGAGNNPLIGGPGDDTLIGSGGIGNALFRNTASGVVADLAAGTASDGLGGTDTLIDITGLDGSQLADRLSGDERSNDFAPRGGDDTIDGRGGFDSVHYDDATGGIAADLGAGTATSAAGGNDQLISIEAVNGGRFADSLAGSEANDRLNGADGGDTLAGAGGDDTLMGGGGQDVIRGGEGADVLLGGAGDDALDGGGGDDFVAYWDAPASVQVNLANGAASDGAGGSDTLLSITSVIDSPFNDTLVGSDRDNLFAVGAGNDFIDGGGDLDVVAYWAATGPVLVDLTAGSASGGGMGNDTLMSIEVALGGEFNDTLLGTSGPDRLAGNGGNDSLRGLTGNDTLTGGEGLDTLDGGDGWDWIGYAFAPGAVNATLGLTTLDDGSGADTVIGVEGLLGSRFADRLTGNSGPWNFFNGGDGNDTLDGGAPSDESFNVDIAIYAGSAPVSADLRSGTVAQGGFTDTLIRIDAIFSGDGADTLRGIDGPASERGETLRGSGGDDSIDGGSGVDAAEFLHPRSEYTLAQVNASTWTVRDNAAGNGDEGTDRLTNIERIVFADQMLSFGTRAEELARVAFVLWSPAIVGSAALFARGLSFYDVGYDFATMSIVALQFWTGDSDAQLAQRLITNSGSTKTTEQLLATMAANGGSVEGRAAALREIALDPATTQRIEDSGIRTTGLVSDHSVPGFGTLFGLLPG